MYFPLLNRSIEQHAKPNQLEEMIQILTHDKSALELELRRQFVRYAEKVDYDNKHTGGFTKTESPMLQRIESKMNILSSQVDSSHRHQLVVPNSWFIPQSFLLPIQIT